MEAFSLLKYWRTTTTTTPITTTAASPSSSSSDEGPYFDLEFSLPDQNNNHLIAETETETDSEQEVEEVEEEVEVASSSSYDSTKEHFSNGDSSTSTESTTKPRNNLFKSASKFRVLMALKLKKLKENGAEEGKKEGEKENQNHNHPKKFFTVKFIKVEEAKLVSLFSRDGSSKTETRKNGKENSEKDEEEKRVTKDMMHRYLKMMKPLYVRASKRYGEKMRFSGQLMRFSGAPPENVPPQAEEGGGDAVAESGGGGGSVKERNLAAGLRVVRKHLGKSKSASLAAVVEAPPVSRRRDDSLMEQQDGIQSAILHCKRSFNSSRESSVLLRSSSHQPAATVAPLSTEGQVV